MLKCEKCQCVTLSGNSDQQQWQTIYGMARGKGVLHTKKKGSKM